jgi:hypothetical protein
MIDEYPREPKVTDPGGTRVVNENISLSFPLVCIANLSFFSLASNPREQWRGCVSMRHRPQHPATKEGINLSEGPLEIEIYTHQLNSFDQWHTFAMLCQKPVGITVITPLEGGNIQLIKS